MYNRTFARSTTNPNPFSTDVERPGYTVTEQFESAVVVDVIVNNTHTQYAQDGYNVGAIKFRFLNSSFFQSDETLHWAFPMNANISEYPLLNEVVYVFSGLNRFYYFPKFNVSNRPTSQGMFGLNQEAQPITSAVQSTKHLRSSAASPIKAPPTDKNGLGEYFVEPTTVYRLKHLEGDVVYEGRTGQSIRMGTSWLDGKAGVTARDKKKPWQSLKTDQSPNILIRTGADPQAVRTTDTAFGQVIEDINTDKSSLWMVSDQVVKLKYSTESSGIHRASIADFPTQLDGNQIVVNTDRFVINTKTDKILGHSALGIHWTTLKDYTVDADQDHRTWTNRNKSDRVVNDSTLTVGRDHTTSTLRDVIHIGKRDAVMSGGRRISMLAPKIHIGSPSDTAQPLVLGNELIDCLNALISAILAGPIVASTGSPGSPSPLNPSILVQLNDVRSQFLTSKKIVSDDNFTVKKNSQELEATNIKPYREG